MDDAFEALLADLSERFTGLPVEAVDDEIRRALRVLVEWLDTDRASFFRFTPQGTFLIEHSWARPWVKEAANDESGPGRMPWYQRTLGAGQVVRLARLPDDLPEDAREERAVVVSVGMKAHLAVPITVGGAYVCALSTGAFRDSRDWAPRDVSRLRLVGQILANAFHRRQTEARLRAQVAEIQALKDRLEAENIYLRDEVRGGDEFADIVGRSAALRRVLDMVAQVAPTDASVLLLGETGTGKELFARALHERSPRRAAAFIKVNCASLPATLIESELLGHEKGAFTGAIGAHPGRFELADGGTLFLDEIGELAVELQAKLLRVLQDGEVQRLGATRPRRVNVRLLAATNQDLERAIAEGRFRRDLYYRLNVFPIRVPPLRDRREDIQLITWAFIQRRQGRLGRHFDGLSRAAMEALVAYDWPGNVRELENVLERAMILSPGPMLHLADSLGGAAPAPAAREPAPAPGVVGDESLRFDDVSRDHIRGVLERCSWRINGPGGAAEVLAVHPNTLRSRMRRLGIVRPRR